MAGAEDARDALQASVDSNRVQVTLTEESRQMLAATLRDEMGDAFARGLKDSMSTENARQFMRALISEAQTIALEKSDKFAGSIVRAGVRKLLFFVVAGSVVYALGGWGALAAVAKWLAARSS